MNHKQATTLWSRLIVEELVRQGAGTFCISPGSRSTPLTIAVARNPKARYRLFPDERSAAFYALGHAKATGMPAVLICTSGTAVANYFPAVIEASSSSWPMLILSADRPFELLDAGANQTIRQRDMFGSYTRWTAQLPEPGTGTPLKALLSTIGHAVRRSLATPAGPVHINAPFREPLEPEEPDMADPWAAAANSWLASGEPHTRFTLPEALPADAGEALLSLLQAARRPLIFAGSMQQSQDSLAVEALAERFDIPLLGDLASGIRLSRRCRPWQLAFHATDFAKRYQPDLVLHFGGALIGKPPAAAIRECKPEHLVVVRSSPERFDPDHNATLSIQADPAALCKRLLELQPSFTPPDAAAFFEAAEAAIEREACLPDAQANEVSAARIVSRLAGSRGALFVANSMPARDMDLFADPSADNPLPVALNRGASGIDGIISTAAGFAAGLGRTVTLLIGDISFLHDLNALSLLSHPDSRVVAVVLNNHGGGIFSFLPVSAEQDVFETCFATPQQFSIESAAATFGLAYRKPDTNAALARSYADALESGHSAIIEVEGSREENLALHQQLKEAIADCAPLIRLG